MNVKLLYCFIKFITVLFICAFVSFLIRLLHFIPYEGTRQRFVIHFFDGVWGIFTYLLPLFIIWYLPISIRLTPVIDKKVSSRTKWSFYLFGSFVLAFIFTTIFGNEFNYYLFTLYTSINIVASIGFHFINRFVNKLFITN